MSLLGLLSLRKILIHILDVDERPCEVVAGADDSGQVALVGKPAVPWRYRAAFLMLGSSYTLLMASFGLGRLKSLMYSSIVAEEGTV